jgi:hypothetical protein
LAIALLEHGRRRRARNERVVFPCECGCREVVKLTKAEYQTVGGAWLEGHEPGDDRAPSGA